MPQNSADTFALGNALQFDPAAVAAAPVKPLKLPGYAEGKAFDVSRADKPDGSSTITLKQPLPIDIETRFGADVAPAPSTIYGPGRPLPGSTNSFDSGAAWASVGVANLASLDARVDPDSDRGKVGTTLHHAMPIGSKLSVTLQDTFSVTDTLGTRSSAASARAAAGGAAAGNAGADAVLGQRAETQIRGAAHRHQPLRRRHHQQHRSGHPQRALRRPENLRPIARDHFGQRCRRADQQQEHHRRFQAELVTPP